MKTFCLLLLGVLVPMAAGAPPVPRGSLRLSIAPPPGQSVPRELEVRVRPTRQLRGLEASPWEVTVASPVRDGEIVCQVPAGRVDLRFLGTAQMPVYRWGVTVTAGETTDLGVVKLERGASISGWLRTRDEAIPTHSILLSLEPEQVNTWAGASLRTLTIESTTRPWGFFQFAGVQPGRYVVHASDPGLPASHSGPILIEGDRSFEMPEPLAVLPQVELAVKVDPPWNPERQPWNIVLQPDRRLDPGESWPLTGTTSNLGQWHTSGLPPGEYWLGIGLAGKNVWEKRKVRLAFVSQEEKVSLSFVSVRGRLSWRGNPLLAALNFSNEWGRASLSFDAQGSFKGYLPNAGPWEVGIVASELKFRLNLQDRVRVPKAEPFAWLDLRIPDTMLPLEVVDERGRGIPGSRVDVLGKARSLGFADDDGRLKLIGLKPGPQCVQALRGSWWGPQVPVAVGEGDETPLLRLVVPDKVDIAGRIRPRLGFGAGAQVLAWPAGSGGYATAISVTAGENGGFGLSFPAGTRNASLVVLAPGNALRLLDAEVSPKRLLEIHVDTPGGTLVLELPGQDLRGTSAWTEDPQTVEDPCSAEYRERHLLTMARLLRRWADLQGTQQTPGQLVVPNVEPGPYTLCVTDQGTILQRGEPAQGDPRCVGGTLEAAGELRLKLPVSSAELRHPF